MKRFLIKTIALVMSLLFIFPATAYAEETITDNGESIEWYDLNLTEEEADEILANNSSVQPYANDLISLYNIAVAADGTTLKVVAKTYGSAEVIKAGFTEIVIQRKSGVSGTWTNYITFKDIYSNSNSYLFSRAITVSKGYYYRATCVHYAKKNILSTQKISNTSNMIVI